MDKKYEILNIDETKYKTQVSDSFKNRKNWQRPNEKKLYSFIPGTIQEINVQEGSVVEEGDELLILEAMKMRNKIKSPISGKIKHIFIKQNEIIQKKHLIIEFE